MLTEDLIQFIINKNHDGGKIVKKRLELDSFLNYRFLSELSFAPDGKQAALVVSNCDEKNNCYHSDIWLYREKQWLQLTSDGKVSNFEWEDTNHILFPAARTEEEIKAKQEGKQRTVFYRLSTQGGEATAAFCVPLRVQAFKYAGSGKWLLSSYIDLNCPDYYKHTEEEREIIDKQKNDNKDYEVLTEIPFYQNGSGFSDKRRSALFLYEEAEKKLSRLTDPEEEVSSFTLSDDKAKLWYVSSRGGDVLFYNPSGITEVTLASGKSRRLTEDLALEPYFLEYTGGKLILAAEEKSCRHIAREGCFYLVDCETGGLTLLFHNQEALFNSTGSDCRYGGGYQEKGAGENLWFLTTVRDGVELKKLNTDGAVCCAAKCASIDCFDISPSGDILCVAMTEGKLQEVYRVENSKISPVSSFNEEVLENVYIAPYRKLTITSQGKEIDGWILYPKDYREDESYPAILDIHGGPRTAYGEVFCHEMQFWANEGYFVFFCNPVGSSGRGWEFADITGRYGEDEYRNLMDFTNAVLEACPQIDPKRMGCTGGSYGGYMANWILGHTDRFAAVATQRSISNWISFSGTSDIGYFFTPNQHGADIYSEEGVRLLWNCSPLKYVSNMKTPTLFIHSDEDYRCPIEQGLQLFTALKEKGVPARFVWFKGENHELSRSGKPLHRIRRLQEITAWMNQYCKENK